jgi:hypothetical protein
VQHKGTVAAAAPRDNAIKFPVLSIFSYVLDDLIKLRIVGFLEDVFKNQWRIAWFAVSRGIQMIQGGFRKDARFAGFRVCHGFSQYSFL